MRAVVVSLPTESKETVVPAPPLGEPNGTTSSCFTSVRLMDWPDPHIGEGDVLLQPRTCGLCGTDLDLCQFDASGRSMFGGPANFPVIVGHEVAATVVAVGKQVRALQPGEPVVVDSIIGCGVCECCRSGREAQCKKAELIGLTRPGGLADLMAVPERGCHSLRPLLEAGARRDMLWSAGAIIEPLCCAYHALTTVTRPIAGSTIVVFGLGPIGVCVGLLARAFGAAVLIGVEPIHARREWGYDLGFDHCVAPESIDRESIGSALSRSRRAANPDLIVEATGSPLGAFDHFDWILGPSSEVLVLSRTRKLGIIDTNAFVSTSSVLRGSRGPNMRSSLPKLLELISSRSSIVNKLIGFTTDLAGAVNVLRMGRRNLARKTVVRVQ